MAIPVPGLRPELSTLVEVVQHRALSEPTRRAYSFLDYRARKGQMISHVNYAELDAQARAVAVQLRSVVSAGERALLLFRPGLRFISCFLGCLYAEVIAVPAPVPRFGRRVDRLEGMMADAQAAVILTTASVAETVKASIGLKGFTWAFAEEASLEAGAQWKPGSIQPDSLAFLQYSSGSTGSPKGIMVQHKHLMQQLAAFHEATGATRDSCLVSWLPIFHDLGLIGGVLQPLYGGYPGVLMSPETFLGNPERWLRAVSEHRADISMAPDFAYEACVRRVSPDIANTLDLSSWRFALNGAEPIRARTIERFAEVFAASGFRREAFYPAYGLAEATLMVTGGSRSEGVTQKTFSATGLEKNRALPVDPDDASARWLVGCGLPVGDQQVLIVDPEGHRPLPAGEVGEVWVAGSSVCQGYWRRRKETLEVFEARLSTGGETTWLRTGDLGFVYEGELFICGRWKDLIIIRGNNHHAPDIEFTVQNAHPGLRPSCGAAFSVDVEDKERLVVVQEVDRRSQLASPDEFDAAIEAIRHAVTRDHEIQVYSVVLLRHGSLPKTSSGKIQRRACRQLFLEGSLKIRAEWLEASPVEQVGEEFPTPLPNKPAVDQPVSAEEIRDWLVTWLAGRLNLSPELIQINKPFADFGLDSVQAVELVHQLESWLGAQPELDATALWNFPTIDALVRALAAPATELESQVAKSEAALPALEPVEDVQSFSDAELLSLLAREVEMARGEER